MIQVLLSNDRNAAACRRTRFASMIRVLLSNDRNAPLPIGSGAKLVQFMP